MLDAHIGTIDFEDETLEDAIGEVRSFLDAEDSSLDRSHAVLAGGRMISAVLVSLSGGRPFIGYVMTLASRKKQGLARLVVTHALTQLAADGHQLVVLYMTEGNTPSEHLFHSVGAVQVTS